MLQLPSPLALAEAAGSVFDDGHVYGGEKKKKGGNGREKEKDQEREKATTTKEPRVQRGTLKIG